MVSQLSTEGEALRLFFTEEFYVVDEHIVSPAVSEALPAEVPQVVVAQPLEFKFLGKNKRNILILVNDGHNDVSDETGRELLRKIVKSINLTADDFALVNYARYSTANFEQIKDYFNCELVFAFGVSPANLALPEHPENVIVQERGVRMVFSAALPKLNDDAEAKKALWRCLKNLN